MIIPVKCFTCGKVLANKYLYYIKEVRKKKIESGEDLGHKNRKSNNCNLCKKCHKELTKKKTKHVRKKTTAGIVLEEY